MVSASKLRARGWSSRVRAGYLKAGADISMVCAGKLKAKELIPYLSDFAAPPESEEDEEAGASDQDSDASGKVVPQVPDP